MNIVDESSLWVVYILFVNTIFLVVIIILMSSPSCGPPVVTTHLVGMWYSENI